MQNLATEVPLTVVFVCRNHSQYVLESLNSVLRQDVTNIEILIFDVASEDDSVEKIATWRKQRASDSFFHGYDSNVGIVRVVKDAVEKAKGEYVRLISTDDFFTENSLRLQLEHFKNQGPLVAVCFADARMIDQEGKDIGVRRGLAGGAGPQVMTSQAVRRKLMSGNWITAPTVMLHKARVVYSIRNLDESIVFEDYQLWMRLSENFDFLYLPEVVVAYRQHQGSFSNNKKLASLSLDGELKTLRRAIRKTPTFGFRVLGASRKIAIRSLALNNFNLFLRASWLSLVGLALGVARLFSRSVNRKRRSPGICRS